MREDCAYFRALIERSAEESLTETESAALSAHLAVCSECRALQSGYAAIRDALRADIEPPAALSETVMHRVRAYGAVPQPRRTNLPRRRALAAAACLVLLAGIGAFSLLRGRMGGFSAAAQTESIAMDMAAPVQARSADTAPAGGPELPESVPAPAAEPEEAFDDIAEMAMDSAADMGAAASSAAVYTIENPAYVPEGREDAFRSLLSDARWPDGEPEAEWHAIAAVEYRGVIYEFLTDDGENYLLWRDAAEGLPVHSPGTVAELWAVLG